MPISNIVEPRVWLGAIPSCINHERISADRRCNIDFPINSIFRLVIHDVTTMVRFDQGPATGRDWRKNEVTYMVLELLYHCIKIAVHQEQMGLGTANRLSRLEHSNYWVGLR